MFISLSIKIIRLIFQRNMKAALISLLSFYFGFILTAFQIVFMISGLTNVFVDGSGDQANGNN